MTAPTAEVMIKMEGTEIQSYLESFNKEIGEGENDAAMQEGEEEEDDDEEEDGGCYFVDQSGNYYYQASKDSEPVLTTAPPDAEIEEEEDDEEEITEELNADQPDKQETKDISYVLIMEGDENKEHEGEEEDDEDALEGNVYEFDDLELTEMSMKPGGSNRVKTQSTGGMNHMCNYCNYTTNKRFLLARHMKSHSEDRPHKCSVCERGFKTLASLQNHVNTHTGTKPHHCKHCESSFTTSGELVRHVRYRHTYEKPHKCPECDYASVELSKLKRHIRCHTGERPYQCPHCTYASPDTFKLKRHLRIHTGEKPYECDVCHARFTQSNSLKAHKLIHQVGDKPVFHCELCPTTCGRKTDLRIHVQKLHTPVEKPLKCRRCNKIYQDRYTYKMHTKTHEGEKCYKCDLCPYASISARHLESHILVHTDQKPFQCEMCEQSFRQKQLLRRHVNLYHNPDYVQPAPKAKTHKCPSCPRAFRHKGNLIRHMALHDPESSAREEQLALKEGRQKRLNVTLEEIEEEDEEEYEDEDSEDQEVMTVEGEDGQYVVLEVIQLQDDEEQKPLSKNKKEFSRDVAQSDEEEKDALADTNADFILHEADLTDSILMSTIQSPPAKKARYEMLNSTSVSQGNNLNKDMSNCFGFDDDDDDDREGRVIVEKSIRKLQRGESYDRCQSFDDKKFVIDKNGKICERKKKGRLYSLGGNDPPRRCHRGRLDRLKTVGTFDISNEISRLSQKTMNLNERIIGNQLFAQTVDEVSTTAIGSAAGGIGAGLVPFIATAAFGPALTNPGIGTANHHQQQQQQISGVIRPSNGPTLLKQNTEIIHLSPHHHLPLNHPLMLQKQQQQLKAAKCRSLSTGSYITKESSVHSSVEKITKSNSNSELTENAQKTIDTIPKNKSLEDSRTMRLNQSHYSPMRKPILRKSKKIIRTDSEFLKGNIYEKESSLSSSQYTPTHEKRREFAEYRSSNPSSETHKSTDESSKNISTDEIDTVFSDTMELEQMEADYKMHLKNNLQREYKSDSDTLDEVGKKQPDYSTWKNQSYENTFDIFEEKEQEQEESGSSLKETIKPGEEPKKEAERSKSEEVRSTRKPSETDLKSKRMADRPTELELGTSSDGSKNPSVDGSFGHIFEKNLGRFKKMNKLLKCKRFSTSALYDKKSKPNFKETMFFEDKTSPAKTVAEPAERSPVKSYHSQSKVSISSSKSSLFGTKKGNVFTLKGKKFLFSAGNNATSNGDAKTSPNKSKSNNEISYFRTKSTKGSKKSLKNNSTACLNLETTCTSPLSEAFYNTTGSVRLSAMELYEKFCSQDFSGLYKHEAIHHSDGHSATDSEQYDPNRSLGAIRKYKRRNFKLLRQKSEPKFSFRSDTLYENEDSYDDTCYPDEEQKGEYEVEDYSQFLYDEQYYEEDIENLSIENIYYRGNLVREDGTVVEAYQYQEEDDEEEDEEEEDEEEEEEDDDEEEDEEEDEQEQGEQGIAIPERNLQPPHIDMATSMDSDCDEIYLMPQNESKKLIIHDFLFHHSNNEFDNADDEYEVTEEELEAIEAGKDQETLTIYKICSKESILSSKGDLDNIALSSSLDPYFLKSDCLTALERTASLELLSNSSGTLNKSTLTDYAFDTVKNVNLDSCSTSRLSLSLKSEIFEETLANGANSGSGEIKQIKNWNIEDFTLTPEGSFSDETMDELLKTHLTEEGDIKTTPTEVKETVANPSTSEYTIIDLDEEPYMLDPAISDFTNEITKEFDLLFSRAETESRAASYSGSPAFDEEDDGQQSMHLDKLDVQPVAVIELPTRYSMQKLEPINLDADEITITRHTEDQHKMQHDSAKEVAVVDNKCSKTVDKLKPSEQDRTTTVMAAAAAVTTGGDRLRKARSQSLGNLKNKTKCFPL